MTFLSNVDALRTFVKEVGGFADQYDDEAVEEFRSSVRAMVKAYQEGAGSPATPVVDEPSPPAIRTTGAPFWADDPEENARVEAAINRVFADPERKGMLIGAIASFARRHPQQGSLLRKGAVVTLMTHFEDLVADLAHVFYRQYPEALPADQQNLTLATLRDLGSIEDAQAYIIDREIDGILRESLEDQLKYFEKRPKVGLGPLAPYSPRLLEVDQRRHLFVHNRGLVNKRYLERVDPRLVEELKAEDGKPLPASSQYLISSIDLVELTGVILAQLCWRKWFPGDVRAADTALIRASYENLKAPRMPSVIDLALFASGVDMGDDEATKIMVVNHAIALRETGAGHEVGALLEKTDWSACSWKFKAAVHVLRGEIKEAIGAARKAAQADEISADDLADWPLFQPLRDLDEFRAIGRDLFPSSKALGSGSEDPSA